MSKSKLKLNIFEHGEFKLPSKKKMKKWVKAAIERDTELNVMFVGEEEGREMNAQYRHKDYATNVLTFDYQHEPVAIADLVICVPVLINARISPLMSIWLTYLFTEHCTRTVTITWNITKPM